MLCQKRMLCQKQMPHQKQMLHLKQMHPQMQMLLQMRMLLRKLAITIMAITIMVDTITATMKRNITQSRSTIPTQRAIVIITMRSTSIIIIRK